MRASDTDRQRTIDELRRHCAAGRIDVDEYASRIEAALTASTLEELDQLRADLPMLRIADPGSGGRRGIWADRGLPSGDPDSSAGRGATGSGPAGLGAGDGAERGLRPRLGATAMVMLTVLIVLSAVVISLTAQWTWAALLLAGWLIGLAQGRLGRGPQA